MGQLLLLAAAGHSKEGAFKIIPPVGEIVWGAISFFVLLAILWKFAFPAMKKALDQRAATISADLERAEEAKLEAEQLLAEYREQLAGARQDAAKIIEDARRTADEMKKELLAKANDEAAEILAASRRDIETAVAQVKADLQRQMAEQSVALAGKIIERELDPAAQADLIDRFISELSEMEPQP
jgi:F-type H+-transporting ATPase subunit b